MFLVIVRKYDAAIGRSLMMHSGAVGGSRMRRGGVIVFDLESDRGGGLAVRSQYRQKARAVDHDA